MTNEPEKRMWWVADSGRVFQAEGEARGNGRWFVPSVGECSEGYTLFGNKELAKARCRAVINGSIFELQKQLDALDNV